MTLLPVREGGAWEGHVHGGGGHDHAGDAHGHVADGGHEHPDEGHGHEDEHASIDGHLWLDPANARRIVETVADALGEVDPANAAAYRSNAAAMIAEIEALERELDQRLGTVRDRPYVVFHDAYRYFEEAFGLNAVGSITISPDIQSGARRLAEIRQRIVDSGASCVFSEPLIEARLIDTVTEGLDVGRGELDPEGTSLPPGRDLYPTLMRALAEELVACLGRG
jgi:zinc transport system substrate-binding protein